MSNVRVAITGAAGQIGYHLAYAIARGEVFGQQSVNLVLIDLPHTHDAMLGLKMEIEDGLMPLVSNVELYSTDQLSKAFTDLDFAFLVGAFPRQKGMERKDLLEKNAGIFIETGKALATAKSSCQVLVVGNPCNSNCLVVSHYAKNLPKEQFFAMTMLDQNRAQHQLAQKAGVHLSEVEGIYIYGNHSATQFPDYYHASIAGKAVLDVLDSDWLENEFLPSVQQRGAEVIKMRGASSAASAARAAQQTASLIWSKSKAPFSVAMIAEEGELPTSLVVSMPYYHNGSQFVPVEGITHQAHAKSCIQKSYQELYSEYEQLKALGVL